MAQRKRWSDLTPSQQTVLLTAISVQVSLAAIAWIDLARRPTVQVRSSKTAWAAAIAVNFIGPISYFAFGRIPADSHNQLPTSCLPLRPAESDVTRSGIGLSIASAARRSLGIDPGCLATNEAAPELWEFSIARRTTELGNIKVMSGRRTFIELVPDVADQP